MASRIQDKLSGLWRLLRKAGPYVVLEVVLPGGTLFAFLLYMHRSGQLHKLRDVGAMTRGVLKAAGGSFDQMASVWQPFGTLQPPRSGR